MRTSVKGIPSESYINSVTLTHNKQDPDNVYLYHCYKCGQPITKVQGLISSITAGYIPSMDVAVISQCRKCKENYTFQTFTTIPQRKQDTFLTLSTNTPVTTFHCVLCTNPLIQYNSRQAVVLPGFVKIKVPTPFICFLPECQTKYYLNDIVEYDK